MRAFQHLANLRSPSAAFFSAGNTERFHAANADDAKEWYDVIKRCVESAHADPAGHRRSSVVGGAAVTPDGKVMTQMKTQMTRLVRFMSAAGAMDQDVLRIPLFRRV